MLQESFFDNMSLRLVSTKNSSKPQPLVGHSHSPGTSVKRKLMGCLMVAVYRACNAMKIHRNRKEERRPAPCLGHLQVFSELVISISTGKGNLKQLVASLKLHLSLKLSAISLCDAQTMHFNAWCKRLAANVANLVSDCLPVQNHEQSDL